MTLAEAIDTWPLSGKLAIELFAAFHEVGHIIVGRQLGFTADYVRVRPDGLTTFAPFESRHTDPADYLAMTMAGMAAESLYRLPDRYGGGNLDFDAAHDLLRQMKVGDRVKNDAMLSRAFNRATVILSRRKRIHKRLAEKLYDCGQMSQQELRAFFERSERRRDMPALPVEGDI